MYQIIKKGGITMAEARFGHIIKLSLSVIKESVEAEARVMCSDEELSEVLKDLYAAVDNKSYISPVSTADNPALSDDYVFDTDDENLILKDLRKDNFVGKIKDLSKGAAKRKEKGYPEEYLYVFKYACKLTRIDADTSGVESDNILIYIKINNRKIPNDRVFVISFHKNRPKDNKNK